jgi:cobalt-zinc-cadmium efflux system outer membrane protein
MHGFSWLAAGAAAALMFQVEPAQANPCSPIVRSNLVRCAVRASLERRAGAAAVQAGERRIEATDPWFPSSPELELTGARRRAPGQSAFNWSVRLGFELDVSGQRGARRRAAEAERDAQQNALASVERSTATEAFHAYFALLAARDRSATVARWNAVLLRVSVSARAAAERGALAGVEADAIEAAALAVEQRQIEARRDQRLAELELARLLGLPPADAVVVEGELAPLAAAATIAAERSPADPPEALALDAERRAQVARASAFRRARVPNPRLSVFAERDGFDENLYGVGVALPLPLPEPLGRMYSGEIGESEALATRASLLAEQVRRDARSDVARAVAAYRAALESARVYAVERSVRAEAGLMNLAAEVEAGRIPVREALLYEEPLLEILLGATEARLALCLASVAVVRAAGLPIERGEP